MTGLESTYLTRIDPEHGVQRIVFSRNSKELLIPAGLDVPWGDTLCKRALEEDQTYTDDVPTCWPDSQAARDLGLMTYLSEPVRVGENELYGTLCGASQERVAVSAEARQLLAMFSRLIARQLERDELLDRLRQERMTLQEYALTDPLTGIPNRRGLLSELNRSLANADRAKGAIHLAYIDLDGFKQINDRHGHETGDRLLIEIAKTLRAGMRQGDFVARIGGDEFVVFGEAGTSDPETGRQAVRRRIEALTRGTFDLGLVRLDYGGASVGVITSAPGDLDGETLLARADAAMYQVKQARRGAT